jgi:RND family efflux transporter MFP subunit
VFLASCSSGDDVIKKRIIKKKQQIAKVEQQIADLEKQLADTSKVNNNIPVEIKELQPESFHHYFTVFGNVEADKYGMISPEMMGRIASIEVEEGQQVSKGQLLLMLNTEAVESQIKALETNLEFATSTFDKQKVLWDQKIGSEMQYLQAKSGKEGLEAQLSALKAQLKMAQLRAPYDGIVNKIYPKKGEMAGPGMPGIEFVNLNNITIRASVSEKYIDMIRQGQMVEVKFASLPDLEINTPVVRASKVINAKSRTFEIELKLKNPGQRIVPNMVSTIRINDFSAENALVIPSLVIKKDIKASYVYVAVSGNNGFVVEKRKVELGYAYQELTMVNTGLKPGDKVIVKGYNLVSSGIPVNIK